VDKKQLIQWLVPVIARGIAWFFAVKLGMDAAESNSNAMALAQGLGAIVLAAASTYTSIKGRKKLQDATPTK